MQQVYIGKVWTGRKALSRARWGEQNGWEKKYCLTVGNRTSWREEKRRLSKEQRDMIMLHQLNR